MALWGLIVAVLAGCAPRDKVAAPSKSTSVPQESAAQDQATRSEPGHAADADVTPDAAEDVIALETQPSAQLEVYFVGFISEEAAAGSGIAEHIARRATELCQAGHRSSLPVDGMVGSQWLTVAMVECKDADGGYVLGDSQFASVAMDAWPTLEREALGARREATVGDWRGDSGRAGGSPDGCVKGKRCGNSCISVDKSCHDGATYRKRRRGRR